MGDHGAGFRSKASLSCPGQFGQSADRGDDREGGVEVALPVVHEVSDDAHMGSPFELATGSLGSENQAERLADPH